MSTLSTGKVIKHDIIIVGELLKQAERYTSEGLHPRLITEGYEIAKDMALEFLDAFKVAQPKIFHDRELLTNVVRTSLRTKLAAESADKMSDAIVDAMLSISEEGQPIDLHMVEVMQVPTSYSLDVNHDAIEHI